jgi:hypothetical protein
MATVCQARGSDYVDFYTIMAHSDSNRFPTLTIVLLILGFVALALAQNPPGTRNAQSANVLNRLLQGKGRQMISQPVTLSNVAVQDTTQNDIVWVGSSANSSVLVMLQPSVTPRDAQGNPTPIAAGDAVRITGQLLRAPSPEVLHDWGVSPAEAARVQRQGVVVQAVTFQLIGQHR